MDGHLSTRLSPMSIPEPLPGDTLASSVNGPGADGPRGANRKQPVCPGPRPSPVDLEASLSQSGAHRGSRRSGRQGGHPASGGEPWVQLLRDKRPSNPQLELPYCMETCPPPNTCRKHIGKGAVENGQMRGS